jgi:carbamoyltransferase
VKECILGIYHPARGVGHDTGVALIDDLGRPIAAQSEERFTRVKMDGGFPFRSLESLQRMTGFTARDLRCVAVPYMGPGAQAAEGARLLLASLGDPAIAYRQIAGRLQGDFFQQGMAAIGAYEYLDAFKSRLRDVRDRDQRPALADWRAFIDHMGLATVPLVRVDHHLAHAAAAYYTSAMDDCLVITCDGVGALKSGIVATGRDGRLRIVGRTFYPHSPGEFWEVLTAICGFHHMKHGGKITGLAAYGNRDAPCYAVMRSILDVDGLRVRSQLDPVELKRTLQGVPREDIAATAQRRLEEVVTALVRNAARATGLRRAALAGGVFANVRLNQALASLDEIDEIYVCPAMGDEGLGLGAALYAWAGRQAPRPFRLRDVYLGVDFTEGDMAAALTERALTAQRFEDRELADRVAGLLAAGKVAAVFRGRMEFGPRALGHRTILYQTTDATVNDWLNKRLGRTEFMPFAPVTLAEQADRCYEGLDTCRYAAEFMTITCDCTAWTKQTSPAVVHLDGTARPQLIRRDIEPFYCDVLLRYFERTGIPSLINTSFNMHEEPIVCSPADAVRAFQLGHLDALAMGPFLVTAAGAPANGGRAARA